MKQKNFSTRVVIFVFSIITITSVVILDGCFNSVTPPIDAKTTCSVPTSEFNTWFESGTVALDGVVKPANSITFPDQPNCTFYKWSYQMFLWLTSPAPQRYGGRGGRIFDSEKFFDVSPPDASGNRTFLQHQSGISRVFNTRIAQLGPQRLPVIFERKTGRLLEIDKTPLSKNGKQLVMNSEGKTVEIESIDFDKEKRPVFIDNKGKTISKVRPIMKAGLDSNTTIQKFKFKEIIVFLGTAGNIIEVEQGQAEGGEVLMSQTGSLVYYSTTVNEVYAYFRTSLGTSPIPAITKFPVNQNELNTILNFATANGKTITDPEALAIEIKTSWIEVDGLAEPEKFIKMKATVPTYDKSDPNIWVVNGTKTVDLAMVGMHVVGSTNGHPEMLWATFEHVSNTPNAEFSYTNSSNTLANVLQSTSGNWLFCANNSAGPFNEAHMVSTGSDIVPVPGFGFTPSNTIRWKAWGLGEANTVFNTEVISINNSVRGQLIDGDVRKNYIQTGTTWTIFGTPPNAGNQVGTNKLTNTTMETYQQGFSNSNTNGTNCFSCHITNTTKVSHVFEPLQPLF